MKNSYKHMLIDTNFQKLKKKKNNKINIKTVHKIIKSKNQNIIKLQIFVSHEIFYSFPSIKIS